MTTAEFSRKITQAACPCPEAPILFVLASLAAALASGDCYIQDPSTAFACELLRPSPRGNGARRLRRAWRQIGLSRRDDGKRQGRLMAVDLEKSRLARLRGNLAQAGSRKYAASAAAIGETKIQLTPPISEIPSTKFSSTLPAATRGVIRRSVDVRWRLRPDDFRRMPRSNSGSCERRAVLKSGGALGLQHLQPGAGRERGVVEEFLRTHSAFRLAGGKRACRFGAALTAPLRRGWNCRRVPLGSAQASAAASKLRGRLKIRIDRRIVGRALRLPRSRRRQILGNRSGRLQFVQSKPTF